MTAAPNNADRGLPPPPVRTGRMRKFNVTMTVTVVVEMDESVVGEVDTDDWRSSFYDLHGPGDIAEHLAFNHLLNGVEAEQVRMLDGFARLPARAVLFDVDRDVDFDTEEIKPFRGRDRGVKLEAHHPKPKRTRTHKKGSRS